MKPTELKFPCHFVVLNQKFDVLLRGSIDEHHRGDVNLSALRAEWRACLGILFWF